MPAFTAVPFATSSAAADLAESDVLVVGVGESAHFVSEFNHWRSEVVAELVRHHGVTHLALEVGPDEAPAIGAWLRGDRDEPLAALVGPLTRLLYGSFLADLRERSTGYVDLVVLGVDLPNSLTLEPSLEPLAESLADLDPAGAGLVARARVIAAAVTGGSAAASAASWSELDPAARDELTAVLARIATRVEMLAAIGDPAASWRRASDLARAAVTTDLMLRAMSELFAGEGLPDDTTLREHYVAGRVLRAVAGLTDGQRIAYLAHDNHIQKTPVVFDGVTAAQPVGVFLDRTLGPAYRALAITHLDGHVPEMIVPAPTSVGFSVARVAVAPPGADSVERAAAPSIADGPVLIRPSGPSGAPAEIRSQSAVATIPSGAFDAVLVVATASTDPEVDSSGLVTDA